MVLDATEVEDGLWGGGVKPTVWFPPTAGCCSDGLCIQGEGRWDPRPRMAGGACLFMVPPAEERRSESNEGLAESGSPPRSAPLVTPRRTPTRGHNAEGE